MRGRLPQGCPKAELKSLQAGSGQGSGGRSEKPVGLGQQEFRLSSRGPINHRVN
jgi:hypothetical protein